MNPIIYPFTLDVKKNGVQGTLSGMRGGETGIRELSISLSSGRDSITFSGEEVAYMFVTRPSDTTPSIEGCKIEGNSIRYEVSQSDVAEDGIVMCQLKIVGNRKRLDEEGTEWNEEVILYAPSFEMEVTSADVDESHLPESPVFTALEELLQEFTSRTFDAEAYAVGTRNGVPVTEGDPAYKNNAKYIKDEIVEEAGEVAREWMETSEAFAVGTRDGVPVAEGDPAYNNNSKFYAEEAKTSASNAKESEINAHTSATDAIQRVAEIEGYKNDAKAYRDEAETFKESADSSRQVAEANAISAVTSAQIATESAQEASATISEVRGYRDETQTYATNAQTSATNAQTSAQQAKQYRDEAQAIVGDYIPLPIGSVAGQFLQYNGSSWNGASAVTPTELNTALENKADKTEVELKADKTEVELKADKTELDNLIPKPSSANVGDVLKFNGTEWIAGEGVPAQTSATDVSFDDTTAQLDAVNVQAAIEKLVEKVDSVEVITYGATELVDDVSELPSHTMYCQISNGSIVKAWIGVEGVAKPLSVGGSPTPKYSIAAWASTLEMEYATLDEIPLSDMNLLMNRHISADYFVEWYKTDNSMLEQFLASDVAMECIGKWDYICDKLFAIPSAKSALLSSDKWEYILKDKVPTMTSNTTPSGEAFAKSAGAGNEAYKAFDGDITTNYSTSTNPVGNYVGYSFDNPICIEKAEIYAYYNSSSAVTMKPLKVKVQGSNDFSEWEDISATTDKTITQDGQKVAIPITANKYFKHIRIYYVDANCIVNGTSYANCKEIQFYGRALNVSVPKMTSNTEPYGEASASSTWTSAPRPAFHAFDGNMPSASTGAGYWFTTMSAGNKQWLEYEFPQNVCVKMVEGYTDPYYQLNTSFDVEAFVDEWAKIGEVKYTGTSTADAFYYISSHVNEDGVSANRYRFVTNDVTATSVALGKAQFYGVDYSELTTIPLTLTVEGAKGDDITITDASGGIVSNVILGAEETSKEVTIDIVEGAEYTFTSSVAKATDGSGANYSKTVTLSEDNLIDITTRLIPNMTSNTTPSGVASASSYDSSKGDTHAPFRAFTDVRDFSIRWHSQNTQNANMTEYIGYAFASKRKVDGFSFTRSTDSNQRDYTVELRASNDETTWVTLHSAAISKSQAEWRISFSNDVAYKYYRLYVIGASYYYNSNYAIEMANVQLYSVDKGVKVMPNGVIYWYGNAIYGIDGSVQAKNALITSVSVTNPSNRLVVTSTQSSSSNAYYQIIINATPIDMTNYSYIKGAFENIASARYIRVSCYDGSNISTGAEYTSGTQYSTQLEVTAYNYLLLVVGTDGTKHGVNMNALWLE